MYQKVVVDGKTLQVFPGNGGDYPDDIKDLLAKNSKGIVVEASPGDLVDDYIRRNGMPDIGPEPERGVPVEMEKVIGIASQMYRSRAAYLGLLGEYKFKKKVAEFKPDFLNSCEARGKSQAEMFTILLKKAGNDGPAALAITALCTEVMEPTITRGGKQDAL